MSSIKSIGNSPSRTDLTPVQHAHVPQKDAVRQDESQKPDGVDSALSGQQPSTQRDKAMPPSDQAPHVISAKLSKPLQLPSNMKLGLTFSGTPGVRYGIRETPTVTVFMEPGQQLLQTTEEEIRTLLGDFTVSDEGRYQVRKLAYNFGTNTMPLEYWDLHEKPDACWGAGTNADARWIRVGNNIEVERDAGKLGRCREVPPSWSQCFETTSEVRAGAEAATTLDLMTINPYALRALSDHNFETVLDFYSTIKGRQMRTRYKEGGKEWSGPLSEVSTLALLAHMHQFDDVFVRAVATRPLPLIPDLMKIKNIDVFTPQNAGAIVSLLVDFERKDEYVTSQALTAGSYLVADILGRAASKNANPDDLNKFLGPLLPKTSGVGDPSTDGNRVGLALAVYFAGALRFCRKKDHSADVKRKVLEKSLVVLASFGIAAPAVFGGPPALAALGIVAEPVNKGAEWLAGKVIRNEHREANMREQILGQMAGFLHDIGAGNEQFVLSLVSSLDTGLKLAMTDNVKDWKKDNGLAK